MLKFWTFVHSVSMCLSLYMMILTQGQRSLLHHWILGALASSWTHSWILKKLLSFSSCYWYWEENIYIFNCFFAGFLGNNTVIYRAVCVLCIVLERKHVLLMVNYVFTCLLKRTFGLCSQTTRGLVGFCCKTWTCDALTVDNTGFCDKTRSVSLVRRLYSLWRVNKNVRFGNA